MQLRRSVTRFAGGTLLVLLVGCASSGASVTAAATDAEWRALATPRPEPLEGAPTVTMSSVQLVGDLPMTLPAALSPELVVEELIVAGLLRRRDVRFVERRRFTAAVEAERNGSRPEGAPPAGVSPGSDFAIGAAWFSVTPGRATLEVRLTAMSSGVIVASGRETLSGDPDAVEIARSVVARALSLLDEATSRPTWADPAPLSGGMTTVSVDALTSFAAGLAAEERWSWEGARRGYQEAYRGGLAEAAVLLARAARLRNGGTLGES